MKQPRKLEPIAEETAALEIQRTANVLVNTLEDVLKDGALSGTQFNVLHILLAAGERGLTSRDIGDRMITRDPDLTRLLDRLEARALVARLRCETDRRRVYSRITPKGVELIEKLDGPVQQKLKEALSHLGQKKLEQLIHLLAEARSRLDPGHPGTCTGQKNETNPDAT